MNAADATYRRLADQFYRETGLQAPGESDPLRIGPARPEGAALARWAIWLGRKRAEQVTDLERQRDDLLAELRKAEWSPWDEMADDFTCPSCSNPKASGHKPGCTLAAAIARATDPTTEAAR